VADVITDLYVNLGPMLFDGLLIEHQCRPRAVAAAGTSTIIVYRNPFLSSLLGHPIQCFSLPILPQRNSPVRRSPGRGMMWAIGSLALSRAETPCNGLGAKDRIMFFAAAIGGRLYGKEQTQADA